MLIEVGIGEQFKLTIRISRQPLAIFLEPLLNGLLSLPARKDERRLMSLAQSFCFAL